LSKFSKNNIAKNQFGFTLIEVLIAITVLSLLMAMMYGIVQDSTETKDKITSEDRDALQLVTALERLELDISQLYSPLFFNAKYSRFNNNSDEEDAPVDDEPTDKSVDPLSSYQASERFPSITTAGDIVPAILNESKTELIFMSTSNRRIVEDAKQSRFSWIRYAIRSMTAESTKEGAEYELVRSVESENIYQKEFNWDNVKEYVLLRDIKSFQFLFWNKETKKFVDSLSQLSKDKETPRVIKVEFVWIDKDGSEVQVERTFRPLYPFFDTEKDEKAKKQETAAEDQDKDEEDE
jgi:prepilin-type N-terminal cleavage/methylation domain-containing protein